MNVPDDATRRRVLTGTGAAIATALAGCGSPGGDEGGEGDDGNASGDGGTETDSVAEEGNDSEGGPPTDEEADDPYAPEENSTQGTAEATVNQRTPDDQGGEAGGDAGGNQSGSGGEGGSGGGSGSQNGS